MTVTTSHDNYSLSCSTVKLIKSTTQDRVKGFCSDVFWLTHDQFKVLVDSLSVGVSEGRPDDIVIGRNQA